MKRGIPLHVLVLTMFFEPLLCLQPNTDEFFVAEFLKKMGKNPYIENGLALPFCSWKGVSCDAKGEVVVKFEASGLALSGAIPESSIGKLMKLESLDLSNNKITALPSDFWSLGSLKNLNLSHNQLSGNLPSNLGNFGQLQSLDLSFNSFTGSIPESISSISSIRVLNLSNNALESRIPLGITQCQMLDSIDFSSNKLSGPLPKGFGAAFSSLKSLNLADNAISGRDSDFVELGSITHLNISGNLFKGSVVGIFGGSLEVIDVGRNQFQGHIVNLNFSPSFDWLKLRYLDMSDNDFSGQFFSGLNHAQNLQHLNLACNRFNKQGFLEVDMLTNLEYLNLSRTNLIGRIPSSISVLRNLRTLDLSKNGLIDRIPLIISDNLQVLDMSFNNLTGSVPMELMGKLHEVERYNFSYNNLSFCASQMSTEVLQSAFFGSVNNCPIAADSALFERKSSRHKGLKLALALSLSVICILVFLLFLAFRRRRKTRMWAMKQRSFREEQTISGPFSFQTDLTTWVADIKQATTVPVVVFEKPLLNFTFADLLSATSNFDRGMLLAEGRFGPVYGGLLPGGIHVAVKVLVHGSTLTDLEAARELEQLGRIKHPNLVPLTGYSLAGDQRIAIYEYMENGNLQHLLYDLPLAVQATEDWSMDTWDEEINGIQNSGSEGSLVNWKFRHNIALGTARALAFLHHGCSPPIIHRDVKASSIYLDSNLEPRLSDFGLAKIFGNELEDEISGSPGYTPPEFLDPARSSPKTPTPKSDVYGFGVVLFELVTGKKPVEDDYPDAKEVNLVSWVRGLVRKNRESRAIDPKIYGTAPEAQMVEALKIGYLCTAEVPSKRPSMQQVVGLLKDLERIKQ